VWGVSCKVQTLSVWWKTDFLCSESAPKSSSWFFSVVWMDNVVLSMFWSDVPDLFYPPASAFGCPAVFPYSKLRSSGLWNVDTLPQHCTSDLYLKASNSQFSACPSYLFHWFTDVCYSQFFCSVFITFLIVTLRGRTSAVPTHPLHGVGHCLKR